MIRVQRERDEHGKSLASVRSQNDDAVRQGGVGKTLVLGDDRLEVVT